MTWSELNAVAIQLFSQNDGVSVYGDVQLSCIDSITGTLQQPPSG